MGLLALGVSRLVHSAIYTLFGPRGPVGRAEINVPGSNPGCRKTTKVLYRLKFYSVGKSTIFLSLRIDLP